MSQLPSNEMKKISVYCGELCTSGNCDSETINLLNSDYGELEANIAVGLQKFVEDPEALPSRIIDLLQLASYIYCADRLANRGERESLRNTAWSRSFDIFMPVLDYEFWSNPSVSKALTDALTFMTGDRTYAFHFSMATTNPVVQENKQLLLFSNEYTSIADAEKTDVMLFSGGLDSLAGAIERLNLHPERTLCLVSHRSNNVTTHTQAELIKHLQGKYQKRAIQYGFECHNKKSIPSRDETQRTRMFLFASIAFAICHCYNKSEFYIYENGVTSINLSKQIDVINARASRTTHPKTIELLRKLFKRFNPSFDIKVPYYDKTKADIMHIFETFGETALIASSVSCSSTRNKPKTEAAHCGCCSQCIDRIFSVFAAGLNEYDTLYADDFIRNIPSNEVKQRLYNTLRLAQVNSDPIQFFEQHPTELMDVFEGWPGNNPDTKLHEIHELFCRYGRDISTAIKAMQFKYDDPMSPHPAGETFLKMVAGREYLRTPVELRVDAIDALLRKSIPITFKREKPKDENDFNDKVQALLRTEDEFTREYPCLIFGETVYRADHAKDKLIIESKFIRGGTTPSKASEGIAADITKIPNDDTVAGILFVVYDPNRAITDDRRYIDDFEKTRENCFVRIYR